MSHNVASRSSSNDATIDVENPPQLYRSTTPLGHQIDYSEPPLPPSHRKFANTAPLGLLAFGTVFFADSVFMLYARGVRIPNMAVPLLVFFGGLIQIIVGLWEMYIGNTFAATLFSVYGSFNWTLAGIFLPSLGVIDAYELPNGELSEQFGQAVGIFLFAWMMVSVVCVIGGLRSSGAIIVTLICAVFTLCFFAIFFLNGSDGCRIAGGCFGLATAAGSWWAGVSGFWTKESTYEWIRLNPIDLSPQD